MSDGCLFVNGAMPLPTSTQFVKQNPRAAQCNYKLNIPFCSPTGSINIKAYLNRKIFCSLYLWHWINMKAKYQLMSRLRNFDSKYSCIACFILRPRAMKFRGKKKQKWTRNVNSITEKYPKYHGKTIWMLPNQMRNKMTCHGKHFKKKCITSRKKRERETACSDVLTGVKMSCTWCIPLSD